MSSQQFYVSRTRAVKLPNTNVTWTTDPRSGRRIKQGTSGGFLRPGALIPADVIDFFKNKKETNGQTLLQNLIENGSIVFEAGASSPIEYAKALPMERTLDPNTPRSRPSRD